MSGYVFDSTLVDAMVAGTLDPAGDDTLADQVAQVVSCHWAAPNPIVDALDRLRRHLGGEAELFAWLDRHPGRPRLVIRTFAATTLLDRFGPRPAVVTALRERREVASDPPDLKGFLPPFTDEVTLVSLSGNIELMLCEGELDRTADAARAALALLQQIAPRARELDPDTRELAESAGQAMASLAAA